MSKAKRILNLLGVIILLLVIVCMYLLTIETLSNRDLSVPIVITTQSQCIEAYNILDEDCEDLTQSEDQLRDLIASDFGLHLYFYKKKPLEKGIDGITIMMTRQIFVDIDVKGYNFAKTFTHEVIHLKKFAGDESWVCFETFKYLYEHEELHSVGVWYGQLQLQGCWDGEYDIRDLIVDYLTNK